MQRPVKRNNRKRARSVEGIRSTLYNPIEDQDLSTLNFAGKMMPLFSTLPARQQPQFMQLWSFDQTHAVVSSKLGNVPVGSVLSYQQKISTDSDISNNFVVQCCFKDISTKINCVLPEKEFHIDMSLHVSEQQSQLYEKNSRKQSECEQWHNYRKNRLTASHFKSIVVCKNSQEKLARRLVSSRFVQTAAMRYGLQQEPVAANLYANQFTVTVFKVGFVINPTAYYLGCSPDRIVFDEAAGSYGLLEIKCPSVEYVAECKYLQLKNGVHMLNKSHEYYMQIIGQMAITGFDWCDFFVMAHNDYYKERIFFDLATWNSMKEVLDAFYFYHFLPYLAEQQL